MIGMGIGTKVGPAVICISASLTHAILITPLCFQGNQIGKGSVVLFSISAFIALTLYVLNIIIYIVSKIFRRNFHWNYYITSFCIATFCIFYLSISLYIHDNDIMLFILISLFYPIPNILAVIYFYIGKKIESAKKSLDELEIELTQTATETKTHHIDETIQKE